MTSRPRADEKQTNNKQTKKKLACMLKWLPLDWRRKKQTLTEKKILKGEAKKSESNMTVTRWSNWSKPGEISKQTKGQHTWLSLPICHLMMMVMVMIMVVLVVMVKDDDIFKLN